MMDDDGDVDMLAHEQHTAKQCFCPIQSKKLASPLVPSVCSLCPSMDLIVLAVGDTLFIHRFLSWQRLAIWKPDDENCTVCSVCWAPDGRSLAVALSNGSIVLHHVEELSSDEDTGETTQALALPHVASLMWAHVGRPHPSWILTEDEVEREATWSYQSRYLDRASTFLPPTAYRNPDGDSIDVAQITNKNPSCHTPLSLLCATTNDKEIHLYLHGRYAIATLDCAGVGLAQNMVCTSDLTHLLVQGNTSRLTLFQLPALAQYRYPLQVISALYCSMSSHLMAIQQCMKELSAAWKSSLKPLDMKLDSLKRLLKNYDVSKNVRTVLYEYILVGSVEDEPVTSALDQFFSNVQMNDQLIQRLERSLHSAVANVETLARRGLLSPTRYLAYEARDLQSEPLVSAKSSVELQRACSGLVLAAEDVVARIVEARFRLRDLVSWLRSAGSQVKARGTAPDSGQRENAKKRRAPHAVVERMATYLQGDDGGRGDSVTESLIGISITEYFSQDQAFVATRRPSSPKSVGESLGAKLPGRGRPTITFAFKRTCQLMDKVFEQPKKFVCQSISQTDFKMSPPKEVSVSICAIHTRLGGNQDNLVADDGDESAHFFCPRLASGDAPLVDCRSWSIIARAASFEGGDNNSVQIFALPLDCRAVKSMDEDLDIDDGEHCHIPLYLTCRLVLPFPYKVKEIEFYGDDGNSSLSVGADNGSTGQEGRQSIGLLVTCPVTEDNAAQTAEDLWLVAYDQAIFRRVSISSGAGDIPCVDLDELSSMGDSVVSVQPLREEQYEGSDERGVVYAKTRRVSLKESDASSQMLLSGSRGVGGVLNVAPSHVELDLFDLEEDEEASDDEEV